MNERYEQLFAQAWIEFAPGHKAVLERFAELIVRECSAKAWFAEQYDMGDCAPISKQIKEHFGVE